ncbi:hypothetical protein QO014_003813 [Kaistia dalseonensis]|uniref:Uncharacterized protein n=1 Tax=Kaistia dalseonensis TaxID=410840 RepID=A0ABU0HAS5_9HYPH|nr:hypothetical protein [Kaistia dalseonensis]
MNAFLSVRYRTAHQPVPIHRPSSPRKRGPIQPQLLVITTTAASAEWVPGLRFASPGMTETGRVSYRCEESGATERTIPSGEAAP